MSELLSQELAVVSSVQLLSAPSSEPGGKKTKQLKSDHRKLSLPVSEPLQDFTVLLSGTTHNTVKGTQLNHVSGTIFKIKVNNCMQSIYLCWIIDIKGSFET